jgi:outer membrane lipoprotein-sorting protein
MGEEILMNVRKTIKQQVIMTVLSILFICTPGTVACAADVHQLINRSIEKFENVTDYTCRLDKRVYKDGIMHEELAIYVKYKKPKHYYFRWDRGLLKGQEVIFAAGKFDDKIVAHTAGLFRYFTMRLDPEGTLAMRKNRHSLKDSGLEKVMHLIETNYTRSQETRSGSIHYRGEDRIDGKDAWIIQGRFPRNQGFYAHEIVIALDKTLYLPVKVSVFDWSHTLVEEYVFRDLRINVGFNDDDFNPDNPEYHFY